MEADFGMGFDCVLVRSLAFDVASKGNNCNSLHCIFMHIDIVKKHTVMSVVLNSRLHPSQCNAHDDSDSKGRCSQWKAKQKKHTLNVMSDAQCKIAILRQNIAQSDQLIIENVAINCDTQSNNVARVSKGIIVIDLAIFMCFASIFCLVFSFLTWFCNAYTLPSVATALCPN